MFESLLAKRYIVSQKRHAVLTVCSIAAALALMTLLFTGLSTYLECFRNIAYDEGHYHIRLSVSDYAEEQQAVADYMSGYGSCTFETDPEGTWALLYFDQYIGDRGAFMEKLLKSTGMPENCYYKINKELMQFDMIDLEARAYMVQLIAFFYVFVLFFVIALRLVIDTAFEISSKEREKQFGILRSIGATPKQIVRIITFEGLLLSIIGIPIGVGLGIGLGFIAYKAVLSSGIAEAYYSAEKIGQIFHFHVEPLLILLGAATGLVWVLLSAYGTGMRVIKMTPIQAITARSNTVKKIPKHSLFGKIFGWTGTIAARNNKRQPKRFLITVVSLTLSITLFASFPPMVEQVHNVLLPETDDPYMNYDLAIAVESISYGSQADSPGMFDYRNELDYDPYAVFYRDELDTVEQSGYFENINFDFAETAYYVNDDDIPGIAKYDFDGSGTIRNMVFITYFSKYGYEVFFGGEPPVPYEELSGSGKYIIAASSAEEGKEEREEYFKDMKNITLEIEGNFPLTDEEYAALSPEEKETLPNTIVPAVHKKNNADFPIMCYASSSSISPAFKEIELIGTLEEYEDQRDIYGLRSQVGTIYCDIADHDMYNEVMDFIENSSLIISRNNYEVRRQINATLAAVRIGITFFNIMIALVAAVNMINILSTGILNRRGELAAMQCVGMTEKQLYKMTAAECLQYVLAAGVFSVILCELLMGGTHLVLDRLGLLDDMESLGEYAITNDISGIVSYLMPLPRIAIAMIASFLTAFAASVLPLRRMQKISLVEQIRSVD